MLPAGTAQLRLCVDGEVVGDLDYRLCALCRLAVLTHLRIDHYRRRGLATLAVRTVLDEYPDYRWSTTVIGDNAAARGFWASIDWPGALGAEEECPHMRAADERSP